MSAFLTKIPVDIDAVKRLLPTDAYIDGVTWNGQEIELRWQSASLATPYTVAWDFPVERLRTQTLPVGVMIRHRLVPVETSAECSTEIKIGAQTKSRRAKKPFDRNSDSQRQVITTR